LNILVKLVPFTIGDIITFERFSSRGKFLKQEFFKVLKVGRIIQGTDLSMNKSDAFEIKYIKNITKLNPLKAQIISTNPLAILDPETFQEEFPKNNSLLNKNYLVDEKIMVVKTEKGIFVVE
jgi:NMD protein affecting ribosome stability and mRNA decay